MTADTDTLSLGPAKHGKIGIIHCGVTREGFIAVAGQPRNIADGEEILFTHVGIRVWRSGSEYTFTRVSGAG